MQQNSLIIYMYSKSYQLPIILIFNSVCDSRISEAIVAIKLFFNLEIKIFLENW